MSGRIHKTCATWAVTQCWRIWIWPNNGERFTAPRTTHRWDRVTCKACLKHRPAKRKPVLVDNKPFTYASGDIPKTYRCGGCGAKGVKLWREYNTFLDHQTLRCYKCAGKNQKTLNVLQIDSDGKIPWFYRGTPMGRTDQIGSLIPAVPTEDNDTFWGYTSVPEGGCHWWRSLPHKKFK